MTKAWQLVTIFQLELIKMTTQSIAGVTYMDHFDFEERYRNVYECDPFYWHPLHLPEYCAEMFEKLIRSKIASQTPVRIVREKEDVVYKLNVNNPFTMYEYETDSIETRSYHALTPYEKMFAYLKRDIAKHPKAPTIEVMPNFGPVAVYRQPISKRSEAMIEKIGEAYAAVQPTTQQSSEFYGHIDVKSSNNKSKERKYEDTLNSKEAKKTIKITKKFNKPKIVTIQKPIH